MESRGSPVFSEENVAIQCRRILCTILPYWPASVLSIAAGMKARSLAGLGLHSFVDLLPWTLVAGEVCLSAWLFSGIKFRSARYVGITVSVGFAIVALVKMVNGVNSCGCFGELDVQPATALFIDLSLIGCLWYGVDRRWPQVFRCNNAVTGVAAITLSLAIALGACSHPMHQSMSRLITARGPESRYVDVNTWVGRQFPLDLEISSVTDFSQGQWTAILYQDSCTKCQEFLEAIVKAPHSRILFIEFPPHSNKRRDVADGEYWVQFRNPQRWFIPLPQILQLNNGVVQRIGGSPGFDQH